MLPGSWRVALDPDARRRDDGHVLLGGAPFRVLRFNDRAARVVERLLGGEPLGDDPDAQALARRLLDAGLVQPLPGPGPRPPGDVTVVVPFCGPAAELAATLAALGPTGPSIVVDDASPDADAVAAAAQRFGARLVRHEANRGPAAARNTGWRQAATDVVAFVDGGCLPDPGWLDALLPHLDDPAVAAVAPRITSVASPTLPEALAAYEQARPSLDRGARPAAVAPRGRVPFVPTATLVARRADLEEVGGFDEGLRFGEDVDLVWRLVAARRTVRYEPEATVRHVSRATTRAWLRQRFDYGASAAPLARRHDDAVRPLGTAARVAAAWALAAGGGVVPGVVCAGATTVALARKLPPLPDRGREALRLSLQGHAYGGLAIVDALRRPWWPLLALAALGSRRGRRLAALVVVVPPAVEWARERPPLAPLRWIGLRLIDDVAYGSGVWAGCWRGRSARALRPVLVRDRRPTLPAAAS
ncbi:mycofactocin biosynthesis glycosyltransferase MftF [Aquihabitans sp. G128]|uniref:mycofactocin biosynthesis glycosyltransferase MftF n=1 Tax=Aquihabitans sp. G128 TaxID=2849779 RepID=UPI001C24C306|nr:mycofactocin biosynthesis glycosyltransferase MftF [Aquihabitans sp. G128]QXC63341.1 mycofactocin biosynthesis glycosyltransferase MftF [Aquihabitans sp. G128]